MGITSQANVAFSQQLGCYDTVITYDDVEVLPKVPTLYADVAGETDLRRRLHHHLADNLTHDAVLGLSHISSPTSLHTEQLEGPQPTVFGAFDYLRTPAMQQEIARRYRSAWEASKHCCATTWTSSPAQVQKPCRTIGPDSKAEKSIHARAWLSPSHTATPRNGCIDRRVGTTTAVGSAGRCPSTRRTRCTSLWLRRLVDNGAGCQESRSRFPMNRLTQREQAFASPHNCISYSLTYNCAHGQRCRR